MDKFDPKTGINRWDMSALNNFTAGSLPKGDKVKEVKLDAHNPKAPTMKVEEPKMFMQRKTFDHIAKNGLTSYANFGVFMFPESAITDPKEWVEVKIVAKEQDKPKDEDGNSN